jgi:4-amino-4-deoxy-L-arabinose transferase-like glycosyltransferase
MTWRWVLALAGLALARSLVLGTLIPPYQSSDEPWHLDYARALASGVIPVYGRTRIDPTIVADDKAVSRSKALVLYGIDNPPMSREANQPPLAYVLPAAGWAVASGPRSALRIFRFIDAVIGAAIVVAAAWAGRRMFPTRRWAGPFAALTVLLLPSMAIVGSTANNDAAATLVGLIVIAEACALVRRGGPLWLFTLLGLGVGVAGLTKATALVLVVPATMVALMAPSTGRRTRVARSIAVAMPALALNAIWTVHNLVVYGDLTGTKPFDAFDAQPGSRLGGWRLLLDARPTLSRAHRFWPQVFRTSVGVLRWSDLTLPDVAYGLAALGAVTGVILVLAWLVQTQVGNAPSSADRRVMIVVGAALASQVAGLVGYAMTADYQPQGRYLLIGIAAASAVVGAALSARSLAWMGLILVFLTAATFVTATSTFSHAI